MTPPLTFIVSQDKITSVQKASMAEPLSQDYTKRSTTGTILDHDQDAYVKQLKLYKDHVAGLLTAHNSPELQAVVKGGQEVVEGVDVEIEYRVEVFGEWDKCHKDTYDKVDLNKRVYLTPVEVAEQSNLQDIHKVDDEAHLEYMLKTAIENGQVNSVVTKAFDDFLVKNEIILPPDEKKVASIIFLAGASWKESLQTTTPFEVAEQGLNMKDEIAKHIANGNIDTDPICDTELFKKLKWDIGNILFNYLRMSSNGTSIEANPATHRVAKLVYGLLQSTPPAQTVLDAAKEIGKWCYDINNDKIAPVDRATFYKKVKETGEHYQPTNYNCFVAGYRLAGVSMNGSVDLVALLEWSQPTWRYNPTVKEWQHRNTLKIVTTPELVSLFLQQSPAGGKGQPSPPAQTVLEAAKEYAGRHIEDACGKGIFKTLISEGDIAEKNLESWSYDDYYDGFIAGASMNGRSGDEDKEGSFGWFIQDIDIILDYAISDKEKLKMIEGKIKSVCATLQQSPAAGERVFTLGEMQECYEQGARDNFKFSGLPSEFKECIVENGSEYFHLKYGIDTIKNK